jgi:pimeloyl-ACP methyl ester carboxylesterase
MSNIFLIPGLGADTRIYNNIELPDHEVTCVDWIEPNETDTLATYAQKLIYQYHIKQNSIIIGNSLGGMLAIEMAKFMPIEKVILISSIRTVDEEPAYFKFFRAVPLYKLVPPAWFNSMGFGIEFVFGKMNAVDKWLFKDMLKKSSPTFLKWSMKASLAWKNKTIPPNVFQMIGDKDMIFPYEKQKDAIVIKGGTHIMIFDKAKEVNKILKRILNK